MSNGFSWQKALIGQIREMLYHPDTGLVYDYVSSFDRDKRFAHLPSPEEVAGSFPNPCGWGTGMEDCALNTGLMLAWSAAAGEESGFGRSLAEGLIRCGNVHGKKGFIVRGILPEDRKSCYPNSSRDQFTLAVYGMWSCLRSGKTDGALSDAGIRFLCDAADCCEGMVNERNHYSLSRLDGGPAVVSGLWKCDPHEMLRLPMIYAAAWDVSGKKRYYDLFSKYIEEGLNRTLQASRKSSDWWDMPLLQMQCSLRFFEDCNAVPDLRPGFLRGMQLASEVAGEKLGGLLNRLETESVSWNVPYDNWRYLPMRLRKETIAADGHTAMFGGLTYLNPEFRPDYAHPNCLIRSLGNYLAVLALDPECAADWENLSVRVARLMEKIDFEHFSGAGTVPLLYGSSLLKKRV